MQEKSNDGTIFFMRIPSCQVRKEEACAVGFQFDAVK